MKRLITSLLVGSALSSAAFADNITTAPTTIPAPVTATSYTAGALLLGNGSSALNVLADTTSGQCLQSNGSGANPVWGSCSTGGGSPGGSSGQLQYNNSGSFGGLSTFTVGSAGNLTNSAPASATNGPAEAITGTYTASTTPDWYISPGNLGVTAFSASGTMLGINAASGYAGNLIDLQLNSVSKFTVSSGGSVNSAFYNITGTSSMITQGGFIMVAAKPSVGGTGLGTSPTQPAASSSLGGSFVVGTSPANATFTLTFASGAHNFWTCMLQDITNNASFIIGQTALTSTTVATFQAYSRTTGLAAALTAGDTVVYQCAAY